MKITLTQTDILNHLVDHYQAEWGAKLGAVVKPKVISHKPLVIELLIDAIREDEEPKEETPDDVDL